MNEENDNAIVDLVPNQEGVYVTKDVATHRPEQVKQPKEKEYTRGTNNLGAFLEGLDGGLDLLEGLDKRVERMLGITKKKK